MILLVGRIFSFSTILWISQFSGPNCGMAQQIPDENFNPPIANPAYAKAAGPLVGVDAGHFNYHKASGRFAAFARLLVRDGYRVEEVNSQLSPKELEKIDILVIANPLHRQNEKNWALPILSAYTDEEIAAVHKWVEGGGSLFLIVDHMPFPGGAGKLAEAFGFMFSNGFAYPGNKVAGQPDIFENGKGLVISPVTRGRNQEETVTRVVTFTGSAFKTPDEAAPVLVFPTGSVSKEPVVAWEFVDGTREIDISGWCQGAILKMKIGRIAVFGEAASFTAQLAGPEKRQMGMSLPVARQNHQLLLNIMHWLSGLEGLIE